MRSQTLALVAAVTAVVAGDCLDTYNQCIKNGTAKVICSCDLQTCDGEDSARIRDYCATATANLPAASASTTGYACNPAHQYPEGRQCVSVDGGFTLLPPTTTVSQAAADTGYACNPAHQYPDGRQCVSVDGGLKLLPPTTTVSQAAADTGYACNPAHRYPEGQVCTEISGHLTLVSSGFPAAAAATVTGVSHRVDSSGNSTSVGPTGTGAVKPSGSLTPYQGAASVVDALSGLAALVAGVVAYIL